jgi:hypothetical protein
MMSAMTRALVVAAVIGAVVLFTAWLAWAIQYYLLPAAG